MLSQFENIITINWYHITTDSYKSQCILHKHLKEKFLPHLLNKPSSADVKVYKIDAWLNTNRTKQEHVSLL